MGSSKIKRLSTPLSKEDIKNINCGDELLFSGTIYTARDAAHKRMVEDKEKGLDFPFEMPGSVIYYAGPAPAKPGAAIGSCGPTTSGRMDAYAPLLMEYGNSVMIGKGERSMKVKEAIVKNCALYLAAIGGAGALIAKCVHSAELIAYPELGAEAVYKLEVKDMPLVAAIDCRGKDLYENRG